MTYAIEEAPRHGRISNLNFTTGTFTYTPARGFSGTDSLRFRIGDSNGDAMTPAAVLYFQVGAATDGNQNGLADAWEALFGLSHPGDDEDGDGQRNLAEYQAGTDPTNRLSALTVHSWGLTPFLGNSNRLRHTLRWNAVAGVHYRVQYSDGKPGTQFIDVVRPVVEEIAPGNPGTSILQSFTDDYYYTGGPPATGKRIFRVKVIR